MVIKELGLKQPLYFYRNNFDLKEKVNDKLLIDFTLDVASGKLTLEQVQSWFEENIETLDEH